MLKPREFRARLKRRAARIGLTISPPLLDNLETYLSLLLLWNQKINLTGLSYQDRPDEAVDRLLIEPLAAARIVSFPVARMLDIGSGGGSPAIPLRLALGDGVQMVLVESKTRKAAFLREALRHLGLAGAAVESARFEELLTRPDLHEAQDLVSVRAVRVEAKTLVGLQAFLRPGGRALLFQSNTKQDISAMTPPFEIEATHPLVDVLSSRLVVLRKRETAATNAARRGSSLFHVEH